MATPRKILVVGDDDHARFLITKTLLRRFPQTVMLECIQGSTAVTTAAFEQIDLAVVHRAEDMSGLDIVRALRRIVPHLPLVLTGAVDRTEALSAGATRCLHLEDWLQLGVMVSEIIAERGGALNPAGAGGR